VKKEESMSRELYEMAWQYGEFKDSPDDDETMDWAAARIRELEQQLAAAQERNTVLQSEHLDHVNALHQQLTDAQERERQLNDELYHARKLVAAYTCSALDQEWAAKRIDELI